MRGSPSALVEENELTPPRQRRERRPENLMPVNEPTVNAQEWTRGGHRCGGEDRECETPRLYGATREARGAGKQTAKREKAFAGGCCEGQGILEANVRLRDA